MFFVIGIGTNKHNIEPTSSIASLNSYFVENYQCICFAIAVSDLEHRLFFFDIYDARQFSLLLLGF